MNQIFTWCRLRAARVNGRMAVLQLRSYSRHGNYDEEFPKITVPQKMVERLEKHNLRIVKEKALKQKKLKFKTMILSSKREEYNHYKGQTYTVFDPKQLASHGWKHRNCPNDHFTLLSHASNPAVPKDNESTVTFDALKLDKSIVQCLEQEGIKTATNIQIMVIPEMMKGRHIVCAAETGSGKTYAYLLPILNTFLQQGRAGFIDTETTNAPQSIIVVPSMELAEQIMGVCTKLSQTLSFQPFMLYGGKGAQSELRVPGGRKIDVLIATPGILKRMLTNKLLSMSRLTSVVLDEADTLLDDSFNTLTNGILRKLQISKHSGTGDLAMQDGIQVALVSATYPKGLESTVGEVLPIKAFTTLTTDHLHHLMPHVPQKFLKMKSLDKLENLLKILKQRKTNSCMIFCNKTDTCHWLNKTLQEFDIDNICVTGYLKEEERSALFHSFQEGYSDILVCTDIASRGLDTQRVDHVINFDFPQFMSDYIHRAGRVGRVGSNHSGHVTSFVVHPWDVELVWKVEIAARRQTELHNVNANIKRKINSVVEEKYGLQL